MYIYILFTYIYNSYSYIYILLYDITLYYIILSLHIYQRSILTSSQPRPGLPHHAEGSASKFLDSFEDAAIDRHLSDLGYPVFRQTHFRVYSVYIIYICIIYIYSICIIHIYSICIILYICILYIIHILYIYIVYIYMYYIYMYMYYIYIYVLYTYITCIYIYTLCICIIYMHVPEGTYSKIPPSIGWFITPSSYTGMSQNRYDRLLDEHPSRRVQSGVDPQPHSHQSQLNIWFPKRCWYLSRILYIMISHDFPITSRFPTYLSFFGLL